MCKVGGSWWKAQRTHGMFTEDDTMFRCYTKIWRIVPRMHEKFTEVDGTSPDVPKVHGWSSNARKFGERSCGGTESDGRSRGRAKSWCKLTEFCGCTECLRKMTVGPDDARKLDRRTLGYIESCLMLSGRSSFRTKYFPRTDKILMEVDGWSCGRTESWWNVSLTDVKLMNVEGNPAAIFISDGCSRGSIES